MLHSYHESQKLNFSLLFLYFVLSTIPSQCSQKNGGEKNRTIFFLLPVDKYAVDIQPRRHYINNENFLMPSSYFLLLALSIFEEISIYMFFFLYSYPVYAFRCMSFILMLLIRRIKKIICIVCYRIYFWFHISTTSKTEIFLRV